MVYCILLHVFWTYTVKIDLIILGVVFDKGIQVTIYKIILSYYNCNLSATLVALATGKAQMYLRS